MGHSQEETDAAVLRALDDWEQQSPDGHVCIDKHSLPVSKVCNMVKEVLSGKRTADSNDLMEIITMLRREVQLQLRQENAQ